MATVVRRETRKRGFFGWIFLIIFILFNIFMLLWMIAAGSAMSDMTASTEAEKTGQAIGSVIGIGILLFVWLCGSVILGLLALLTRGRKTIIEEISA